MLFDAVRFVIGLTLLIYASYTDLKTRRVKNIVWVVMGGFGAIILVTEMLYLASIGDASLTFKLINLIIIPIIFSFAFLLYRMRILFGGADAKAWMAIAILTPFWPSILIDASALPALPSPLPFPFVVISNAVILFLFSPLAFAVYNLARRDVEAPQLFFGYKMKLHDVKNKFVWLMEKVDDGKIKTVLFPSRKSDVDADIRALEALGKKDAWVTPKIPFIVPLTVGFFIAFLWGDIVYAVVSALLV